MRDIIDRLEKIYKGMKESGAGLRDRQEMRKVIDELWCQDQHLLPEWTKMNKPIMCVDFDGCLSEYKGGWHGVGNINGEKPVAGGLDFLRKAVIHFSVLIFSSRCNDRSGINAMKQWMLVWGLEESIIKRLYFQPGKPSAYVIIDDRAIQFQGDWSSLDPATLAKEFKPWYHALRV